MEIIKASVEFIWLPFENEISSVKSINLADNCKFPPVLESLRKSLKTLFSNKVSICDIKPKINASSETSSSMFFAEYLFNVTSTIEFEYRTSNSVFSEVDVYKKLINIFCSGMPHTNFPELYLNMNSTFLIENPLATQNYFIPLQSFSLGNIVRLNTFVEHFNSKCTLDSHNYEITQVKVNFLHDEEVLFVNFIVGNSKLHVKKRSAKSHKMFRLKIPYSSLHTVIISHAKEFSVFFRLYSSPMLYAAPQDEDSENCISYMDLSIHTKWVRSVNLFDKCPPAIRKEFSMNSVLCLKFDREDYEVLKIMLRHKSVQIYFACMKVIPYTSVNFSLQFSDTKESKSKAKLISDFDCFYGYQCLLTYNHEFKDQLMDKSELNEFQDLMVKYGQESNVLHKVLSDALYKIHSAISRCNVVLINHSIKFLLEKKSSGFLDHTGENQGNLLLIKRAIILPTHIRFVPPHPILKSRALRRCDPNYSLRILIRDVNLETINFSFQGFGDEKKKNLTEFFDNYYKKPMLNGIKAGNRIHEYVGSSTSQLRSHGLWFYAKDRNDKTAKILRENFGNMDEIKQVPKYMARMGQTFSQARGSITVPQSCTNVDDPEEDVEGGVTIYLSEEDLESHKFLKTDEEIKSEKNLSEKPYTFSDGIGRMSQEIAAEVYEELKFSPEEKPAAMQIRYAGCKGMLVVDPNLKGKKILFRKSMKKYASKDDSLEIIKVSEGRVAALNRPLITILEQLGVKKEVFVKLQKEMIQKHIKSMFFEPEACTLLNRHSKLRFDFLSMHENGISFTEDPLFRSMIYALFQKQLDLFKNKANIDIPEDKGRAMFGVLDETKTLEYGQVFIQYTRFGNSKRVVHTGTVVVTKNPCMHPGDVRKFDAIDVEDLHHICDCIVFPAKGPRPHPDEMAGSDLDGDEYHVMWYEDFIFNRENEPAMHYAMPKDHSKDMDRDIEPADELEHLCNYIVNDNVGVIASAHLVFADRKKDGIFSENCIRLAKKYAIALDFVKSGRIATRHKEDRAFSYPDFMQKFGERDTYISKKVLGMLFRNCKRLEIGLATKNSEVAYKLDPDLVHEKWDLYKKSAEKTYKYYCNKVEYLMNHYSFANEGELLAGTLINTPKYYEQRHDLDNVMTLLEYAMLWLFNDLQNRFFEEFGKKPVNNHFTEQMYQKASAWYMVAYQEKEKTTHQYFGLPWAVSDVLVGMKKDKCRVKKNKAAGYKSLLLDIVDKHLNQLMSERSENPEIEEIYENRLEVLDVANSILMKWINIQKEHVLIEDIKKFKKLITKEFEAISSPLLSCDLQYIKNLKDINELNKALSPTYYVIETLLNLACIKKPSITVTSFLDARQELSLLSWVTLIKLACTYNPNYLGIGENASGICLIPQDNAISTFKIHLFDKDDYNQQFSFKLLQDPDKVKKYLLKVSQIKDLDFRYDIDRDNKYVAIFTVMGSRYAIEKLKDIVIQDDFCKWVVEGKTLFASLS